MARSFNQLAQAFVTIDADRSQVLHEAVALFGDAPTFEAYEAARLEIIAGYKAKRPAATDLAATAFFGRFIAAVRCYAIENDFVTAWPEKPKSTSEAATKKAAQRALPEAVKNAKTVSDLDAIPMPSDAIEAAKLAKAIAETKVRMLTLETKAAEKTAKSEAKEKADAFIAFFRALPPADQDVFYALRDKRFGIVLAQIPAAEIQAGLKVQQAAEKAAKPAKPAKPATKAQLEKLVTSKG